MKGQGRLVLLLAAACSWLLAIVLRLYGLQVTDHQRYLEKAERQQQREVVLDAPRGTIFDAHGRPLAVSVEVRSAAADPKRIEDPDTTARTLATILGLDREAKRALRTRLERDRRFVWVARKLEPATATAIAEADLPGIFLLPESKRYYPQGTLAAHVLGYVGTDNTGLGGIEARYDGDIASQPGYRVVVNDGLHGAVLIPDLDMAAPLPGNDLHLTIDATIQHITERELDATLARSNSKRGSIVVLDPTSGAVLAMASRPTFDPNHYTDAAEDHRRNRAVADAYEPGSTFKMITLAAALERGAVTLEDAFDCLMGGIRMAGVRISDHKPFGVLTAREVLAKSSNVGAIKIGAAAGRQAFYDMIAAFGFGQKTGIDLPGESAGILRHVDRWSALSPAYISFGQGMSATPIQLARAFAAVAGPGGLPQPHVVARVGNDPPETERRTLPSPVSATTVNQIREVLEGVVLGGTGKPAAVPGYRVAGKTGTAQKAIAGRGYAPNKYVASFIGFVPVESPELVVVVTVDEPWPAYNGSQAAAPAFAGIARQSLLYLGVRPQREHPGTWPGEPELEERTRLAQTVRTEVATTPPDASAQASPGTMPDFTGLAKRAAVREAGRIGLRLAVHGHGYVARQLPAPGIAIEEAGNAVELWLETPTPIGEGAP